MADAFALANAFVRIRPTAHGFRAEADAEIQQQLAGLGPTIKINASTKEAKARATELQAYIKTLADRTYKLRLETEDKEAQAKLTRLYGQLIKLDNKVVSPRMTLAGFTRMQAELLTIDAALDRAGMAAESAGKRATLAGRGWDSLWRSLGKAIPLAGGILGHIAVWHLLLDALIEIIAVYAAAAVAVGAFAVAAIKATRDVITQVRSMNTVMSATNRIIPPMTGNFRKLQEAVRPRVYQIFGAALAVMAHQGSAFSEIAMGASHVLDEFAARLALALTAGKGMGRFLEGAVPVLHELGNAWAYFGVIIGNVFKALPGFAEMLLHVGTELLHLGAILTSLGEPFLKVIFLLHGAIVWGGLAVTAVLGLAKAFKALLGVKIVAAIASWVAEIITLTLTQGAAVAATEAYMTALTALESISPLGWVLIVAGAVAGLAMAFRHSRTETQKFTAALQDMISKAPVQDALNAVQRAQIANTTRLNAAYRNLAATQKTLVQGTQLNTARLQYNALATSKVRGQITTLQASSADLNAEFARGRGHVAELSKAYGGNAAAQGLMVAAGITTDQLLTKSNTDWAIAKQMVEDTARAYKFMGATGSVLSNDMEVLNKQASTQVQAVQKLNQAWDAFISGVTAGQQSFDTFALGQVTLKQNMSKAAAGVNTVTHHLGEMKVKTDFAGAAMDGLSQSSLSLNQAFATQVVNANAVIDQLRAASIGGNEFKRAIRDIVFQMLPFAKGSQQATAQLFALAQEAGIHGPETLSNLVRWLGHTHNATGDLKKIMDDATIQASMLTSAMKEQGNFMANKLIADINKAILAYSGVEQAARDYGKAIAETGRQSDRTQAARTRLINQLILTGVRAGDTKTSIAGMIAKILDIPLRRALTIVEKGIGSFSITGAPGHELPHHRHVPNTPGAQSGMFVSQGTGPVADDVLIRVSKGELVVPENMVSAGAVDHLRGMIPGFAQGGPVKQGNYGVLSGDAVLDFDRRFMNQMTDSMKRAMTAAMKAAIAAAQAALGGAPGALGGPNSASARQAINYAASRMGAYGWGSGQMSSLIPLWMGESGWNRFARNPSSGAYGIPQALPPGKMGPAANPPTSSAAAQINWGLGYIAARYGSPAGAWSAWQARNPHWYAMGTASAAPGPAVVGERGPELVQMRGGESVTPIPGFKKGGKVGFWDKVHHGERVMRHHPELGRHYTRLLDSLGAIREDIRGDRALVRYGHLHGEHLRHARHRLHMDERHHKQLLHEIKPLRHKRHIVHVMENALQQQEHGISMAIKEAQSRHMTRVVDRLQDRNKRYQNLEDWAHWWLNRKWWTPTHSQRVADKQRVHRDIVAVLQQMGLPVISFDRGGVLPPGMTVALNATGRAEKVTPDEGKRIILEFRGGTGHYGSFLASEIQRLVQVKGGGDVQLAFGDH